MTITATRTFSASSEFPDGTNQIRHIGSVEVRVSKQLKRRREDNRNRNARYMLKILEKVYDVQFTQNEIQQRIVNALWDRT